jgi:hypothetical protein
MSAILKMQLPNAPAGPAFPSVVSVLQPERIARYYSAAGYNEARAFQYYVWNWGICESFHFALHFAEISCRNALHAALLGRFGEFWYNSQLLISLLDRRFQDDLYGAVKDEAGQHGDKLTGNHVVSALTFGFWEHLATKRFDRILWSKGIRSVFPNAPKTMTREEIHGLIESLRRWRNRIAHHRAIFDKGPMKKHQEAIELIKIASADTSAWVASLSRVPMAIALRP